MKLYRGIKSDEINFFTHSSKEAITSVLLPILKMRSSNNYSYPDELNSQIIKTHQLMRLKDQYFTDRKDIAEVYMRSENGSLIEIDIDEKEILENFKVEFQDFGKRKKDFQLVYRVDGEVLLFNKDKWNLKQLNDE